MVVEFYLLMAKLYMRLIVTYPERTPFDIITMLSTPYRYDIMQTELFCIK